jgi:hypothetical protein
MHLWIPLDKGCGVLDPLAGPPCSTSDPDERLGRAADFVTALVRSGACKFYELGEGQWVLEVQLRTTNYPTEWAH